MGKTVTIGGNRLGSGGKMTTNLRSYERSTFNTGYLWRSTMAPGTLVPFLVEPALPGDTFDIGLAAEALTLPTIGPLFGSFKLQLDVFQVPIRLYQAQLHNNKLYLGLAMEDINLPQIEITAKRLDYSSNVPIDLQHINPSALLAYLGIRGLGTSETTHITRSFDATPLLAYWDIYKNYYANKQEEIGCYIHKGALNDPALINVDGTNIIDSNGDCSSIEIITDSDYTLNGTDLTNCTIMVKIHENAPDAPSLEVEAVEIFELVTVVDSTEITLTNVRPQFNGWIVTGFLANEPTFDEPVVRQFELKVLDDMREDILAAIKTTTPFMIDDTTYEPYGSIISHDDNGVMASIYPLEGLAIKTYQSDIFNNWLSTEFIENINDASSVAITDGSFSIDTLNLAKKVYLLQNDIAMSGGSYEDWIEATYDTDANRRAETPIYEGGLSREIVFQEVVSNSATEQTVDGNIEPLGTLGGRGVMGRKNKGGKCVIKVTEPSYIIGIVSITPRVDYSQGNRWFTNLKTMNDFHKPALDQIGFQDLITDQMAFWDTEVTGSVVTFKSAGKQPAWINYQTNFNRTYGNFADERKEMFMTLNRRYENAGPGRIKDLTTYIDPSKFNYAFASTALDSQNFWVHIAVDIEARRKMSSRIMPNP